MRNTRLLLRLSQGAIANVAFSDFQRLIEAFNFALVRVSGSHHIYSHPDVPELIDLQAKEGEAKPYQIRQFLRLVEKHDLKLRRHT